MSVHPHQGRRFPLWESPALHKTRGCHKVAILWGGCKIMYTFCFKGDVRRFFLLAQSFYRPQTKTSFKRQFSPKSPKVGQKSGQRVQKWPNKNQVASDLLRESTDSVIRAAEGIHQFCPPTYWGNPLVDNFSIRPAEGIHRFCHRSYWGNPSILSSDLLRESTRVYISYSWLNFKYN